MSMSRGRSYRMVVNPDDESADEQAVVRWRHKPVGGGVNSLKGKRSLAKSGRRVSCLELGEGAHQGWLRTRKPRKSKWDECHKWCVIKEGDLYVYASKMDTAASSRIHLPMFKISEAKETKKVGAFKVHNSGTTFYFRSKTDEEKYEWINHLSLAAIGYQSNDGKGSSTASSGIDSSYSTGTSQAYSDVDETDSSSICDETSEVQIRPKNRPSNIYTTSKLKPHMDTNKDLRRMVTSIREADLDLIGSDRDTRRQSQLRRSLAHAGFSRKNSAKNKKVFVLRAKERQKQALEQELTDINAILDEPSRSNLYDFLSRYPDYQDGISLECYFDADQSSSARSSNDAEQVLTSIDSDRTVVVVDTGDGNLSKETSMDRQTLTPDFDFTRLDTLTLDMSSGGSSSSNRNSKDPVFSKKKYKQSHTLL